MENLKYIKDVCEFILLGDVVKATKYISPKLIVRAVRTRCGKKLSRKGENISVTLTIGKPNFEEREFIQLLQKSKEPFPIKKVQVKFYTAPKKSLKK